MNIHVPVMTVSRVIPELLAPATTVVDGGKTTPNQTYTTSDYTGRRARSISNQNSTNARCSTCRDASNPTPINEPSNQYFDTPANDSFSKLPTYGRPTSTLSNNFIGHSSDNAHTQNRFHSTPINAHVPIPSDDTLDFMMEPGNVLDELTAMFEEGPMEVQ